MAQQRGGEVVVEDGHGHVPLGEGGRRIGPPGTVLGVGETFHFNQLLQGMHAGGTVEANLAVALIQVFLQAEQAGQIFAPRHARGAEGERGPVIHR